MRHNGEPLYRPVPSRVLQSKHIKAALAKLSPADRERVERLAPVIADWIRGKKRRNSVGNGMALEIIAATGRLLNEHPEPEI